MMLKHACSTICLEMLANKYWQVRGYWTLGCPVCGARQPCKISSGKQLTLVLQVRVDRGQHDLQSPSIHGLYPCGEGAGFAGGIVSAAVDGMKVAQAILNEF